MAGEISTQQCPRARQSDPAKQAFRVCGEDGLWVGRPNKSDPMGWTNYSQCFSPNVRTLLGEIYADEPHAQEKFEIAQRTRYLEIVGFITSLVALLISLFIFSRYRSLRNNRTRIHKQLFTAMALKISIQLTMYIDQEFMLEDYPAEDDDDSYKGIDNTFMFCECMYVLLEYITSAVFTWMFIEGSYMNSVVTSNALRNRFSHGQYCIMGWGMPLLVTAAWATVTSVYYNTEPVQSCWFGYNFDRIYWIILGPRLAVVSINMMFLLNIVRVLVLKLRTSVNSEFQRVRKAVIAAVVLVPLLGITEIFNMVNAPHKREVWRFAAWAYGTHFLRSFQGFFISVIYCFLNGEVQQVIRKQFQDYLAVHDDNRRRYHRNSHFQAISSSEEQRFGGHRRRALNDREEISGPSFIPMMPRRPYYNPVDVIIETSFGPERTKQALNDREEISGTTCVPMMPRTSYYNPLDVIMETSFGPQSTKQALNDREEISGTTCVPMMPRTSYYNPLDVIMETSFGPQSTKQPRPKRTPIAVVDDDGDNDNGAIIEDYGDIVDFDGDMHMVSIA